MRVLLNPIAHLTRSLVLILTVVFLSRFPGLQIQMFMYLSINKHIYIGWDRPYKSRTMNNLTVFGEWIVLLTCYNMCSFTDFVTDAYAREVIGNITIGITSFGIMVYLFVIYYQTFKSVGLKARKRRAKKLL
jgi:hypothetical protein